MCKKDPAPLCIWMSTYRSQEIDFAVQVGLRGAVVHQQTPQHFIISANCCSKNGRLQMTLLLQPCMYETRVECYTIYCQPVGNDEVGSAAHVPPTSSHIDVTAGHLFPPQAEYIMDWAMTLCSYSGCILLSS
jgi:hypothetical protein